jgi:hypothetical protein
MQKLFGIRKPAQLREIQIVKTLLKPLLLSLLTLAASTGALVAQPFSIDENGNGIDYLDIVATPPFTAPLPFTVGPDPSRGIVGAPVLIYSLPYLLTAGDVGLVEPGQSTLSDLIRFYNAPGANHSVIIFYSDIDGPNPDLADVGIPYSANPVLINEAAAGADGNSVTTWTPTNPAQPGYYGGPRPVYSWWIQVASATTRNRLLPRHFCSDASPFFLWRKGLHRSRNVFHPANCCRSEACFVALQS